MMSRARKFPVIAPALLILICCLFSRKSMAADVDLRTNVLYWATTTPNLGFDVATSGRFTIGATLGYNAFNFPNSAGNNHAVNPKLHHWLILPEGGCARPSAVPISACTYSAVSLTPAACRC